MPKQELTDEVKRELQILKLRGVLDPKRFYKRDEAFSKKSPYPNYFQFGRVVGAPTDFYSARMTKKERSGGLVDQLLRDSEKVKYFKKKFTEITAKKKSGAKGSYREKQRKRHTNTWKVKKIGG
jgi:hypothetical protein